MELRVFLGILFSGLVFLAAGSFAYRRPSYFGGDFKLVNTPKFFTITHKISSNHFVITNTKNIGLGIIIAGFLSIVFAVTYLFYPEIMLTFNYAK